MFALPAQGTAAREMLGDLTHVVEVLAPANRLNILPLGRAIIKGRAAMEDSKGDAVRPSRISYICLDSVSGDVVLISIGRRGGWRREWNFGRWYR